MFKPAVPEILIFGQFTANSTPIADATRVKMVSLDYLGAAKSATPPQHPCTLEGLS